MHVSLPITTPQQQRGVAVTLTSFDVQPIPEVDGSIVVKADDGDKRIAAFITRTAIADSFPQHHLDDAERIGLVGSNSNLTIIGEVISEKYARGEAKPYHRFGSTILRVDIGYDDLKDRPKLSDDYLLVARGAGFKQRL
jgi:hypothetical protein